MTFTHEIVDTATGQPLQPIDNPSESGYGRALGVAAGQKRTTFQLGASDALDLDWLDLTRPWDRSIIISWDGVPVYWGIITGAKYNRPKKAWTLKHVDFRAILARRYTFGTNGYSGDTEDNILDLLLRSLKSMIPWIVWSGTQGATSNFGLPIRTESGLPLNSTAGDQTGAFTRKFNDWNFTTIEAALTEVQTMPGGPDVDMEPRKDPATGNYYILLRVGGPLLSGSNVWEFDLDSATPGLLDVEWESDGIKMRNVSFAIGTGSEMLMKVATARLTTDSVALEGAEEYKGKDDGDDTLQAHANADLATFSTATQQWSGTMLVAGTFDAEGRRLAPPLSAIRIGDTIRTYSAGDPVMPDGWTNNLLVALDGDTTRKTFTPVFQPIGGE